MMGEGRGTVSEHFKSKAPNVAATYAAILAAAKQLGPVVEEPKKTSIHLVRARAFAGVATQKSALILTMKSDRDVNSKRLKKREQLSANRWYIEVKLETPKDVDRQVLGWLERAYSLAG